MRPALRRICLAALPAALAIGSTIQCYYKSSAPLLVRMTPAPAGSLLIRGARVFTGKPGDPVRENQDLLIRADRIERIASSGTIPATSDLKIIEAAGMTVMPGLIDVHTHVTSPTAPPWLPSLPTPRRTMAAFLFAGVTTILDQGGDVDDVSQLAREQREGKIVGPRVYHPGKAFTAPDGHPAALIRLFLPWPISSLVISGTYHQVNGSEDMTKLIAANKKAGASYTKVYLDEIPLNAPLLSERALEKIVRASRAAGLPVMAHVGRQAHLRMALRAGVKIFVHGPYRTAVNAETIRIMKAKGVVMAPTVNVFRGAVQVSKRTLVLTPLDRKVLDKKELQAMDNIPPDFKAPAEFESWLKQSAERREDKFRNLRAYKAAGITLFAAGDSPNVGSTPGGALHREVQAFITHGGFTPAAALSAVTYHPGRLIETIGGQKGLGYIRPGAPADLLIVRGRPDQDPTSLSAIRHVLLRGRRVIRNH